MYKVEEMNLTIGKLLGVVVTIRFSRPYKAIPNSLCRMYGYGLDIVPW